MFIDEAVIYVKSGKGGDGGNTFRREKHVQFGGPDGGDGGRGGSIIFEVDSNINTLIDFKFNKEFKAGDGENGGGGMRFGKDGADLIIKVPLGTVVRDTESGHVLLDLSTDKDVRLFLKGGRGGRGNVHFKTATRQAPMVREKGVGSKELHIKMELKLLADVALVGYPNVGKSSFINKVSAAKSKVANYQFTTLAPKLGVVRIEDTKSFVIADIPGLIEGAHEGKGLGDKFLKHIERCKMIFHIIDITGFEGRDPIDDYERINHELKNYSEKLAGKQQIVLANKMDMLYDSDNFEKLKNYLSEKGIEVHPISALLGNGVRDILYTTYEKISKIEREKIEEEIAVEDIITKKKVSVKEWTIDQIDDNTYEVGGRVVDSLYNKFGEDKNDGLILYLDMLRSKGLENKLKNAGVVNGDTIIIHGIELEYME